MKNLKNQLVLKKKDFGQHSISKFLFFNEYFLKSYITGFLVFPCLIVRFSFYYFIFGAMGQNDSSC